MADGTIVPGTDAPPAGDSGGIGIANETAILGQAILGMMKLGV
jgi:hypothetical protein